MDTSKQTGVYASEIKDIVHALRTIVTRLEEMDSSLQHIVSAIDDHQVKTAPRLF